MSSKYKVYLSPVAELKLTHLIKHIENEWGVKSKNTFLNALTNSIRKIEESPKSCPQSDKLKGIYKNVLSKQTSYYYRIRKKEIEIITITDNRQNPSTILKEIQTP